MNVNCPEFVRKMRGIKEDRRVEHKARMKKKYIRRIEDHKNRLEYWANVDRLTKKEEVVL